MWLQFGFNCLGEPWNRLFPYKYPFTDIDQPYPAGPQTHRCPLDFNIAPRFLPPATDASEIEARNWRPVLIQLQLELHDKPFALDLSRRVKERMEARELQYAKNLQQTFEALQIATAQLRNEREAFAQLREQIKKKK
jgi:hypothetical protein